MRHVPTALSERRTSTATGPPGLGMTVAAPVLRLALLPDELLVLILDDLSVAQVIAVSSVGAPPCIVAMGSCMMPPAAQRAPQRSVGVARTRHQRSRALAPPPPRLGFATRTGLQGLVPRPGPRRPLARPGAGARPPAPRAQPAAGDPAERQPQARIRHRRAAPRPGQRCCARQGPVLLPCHVRRRRACAVDTAELGES